MTQSKSKDFLTMTLVSTIVIMGAFNIALLRRLNEQKGWIEQQTEQMHRRREEITKQGLHEMKLWQAEILAWPAIEKSLENWQNGQYAASITSLSAAIEKSPSSYLLYYLRAISYQKLGNLEHAISDFTRYTNNAPSSVYGFFYRGKLYFKQKKKKQAIKDLQQAIKQKKDFTEAKHFLEKILKAKK